MTNMVRAVMVKNFEWDEERAIMYDRENERISDMAKRRGTIGKARISEATLKGPRTNVSVTFSDGQTWTYFSDDLCFGDNSISAKEFTPTNDDYVWVIYKSSAPETAGKDFTTLGYYSNGVWVGVNNKPLPEYSGLNIHGWLPIGDSLSYGIMFDLR